MVDAATSPRRDPARARSPRTLNMRVPVPAHRMNDRLHQHAQRWQPAFLATGMSAFVAAVVTCLNTGMDAGLAWRWLRAWSLAWPAAVAAAYLLRPLAWRLSCAVARATLGRG